MGIFSKVKETVDTVQSGYDKAHNEVSSFFVRNRWTIVILSGVAVGIVVLAILAIL